MVATIKWISLARPATIVLENVLGLANRDSATQISAKEHIEQRMQSLGYFGMTITTCLSTWHECTRQRFRVKLLSSVALVCLKWSALLQRSEMSGCYKLPAVVWRDVWSGLQLQELGWRFLKKQQQRTLERDVHSTRFYMVFALEEAVVKQAVASYHQLILHAQTVPPVPVDQLLWPAEIDVPLPVPLKVSKERKQDTKLLSVPLSGERV